MILHRSRSPATARHASPGQCCFRRECPRPAARHGCREPDAPCWHPGAKSSRARAAHTGHASSIGGAAGGCHRRTSRGRSHGRPRSRCVSARDADHSCRHLSWSWAKPEIGVLRLALLTGYKLLPEAANQVAAVLGAAPRASSIGLKVSRNIATRGRGRRASDPRARFLPPSRRATASPPPPPKARRAVRTTPHRRLHEEGHRHDADVQLAALRHLEKSTRRVNPARTPLQGARSRA